MAMRKTIRLGHLGRLRILAKGNALATALGLWVLLALAGRFLFLLAPTTAILAALVAVFLHYLSELWHNLGHAWAARRTGYPMSAVMFVWALAASLYPPEEPELPAKIHIQRALGGPAASALLTLASLLPVFLLRAASPAVWLLALFLWIDNLLVFTIGALIPLGFNDGSTILRWLRR